MFVPEGFTEDQVFLAITHVSKRLSKKFAFACFTAEDLEQECFKWAMEALPKVEKGRPLENFFQTILKRKLINLRRNKLHRPEVPCRPCERGNFCTPDGPCPRHLEWVGNNKAKADILYPVHIDIIKEEEEPALQVCDRPSSLEADEIHQRIAERLNPRLRGDFLRMVDGAPVDSEKRRVVKDAVRTILWEDYLDAQ